ncbi:pyruvate oxidoreductase subunit gamma [Ectothiorhodospiraceae bacterium BW-2]|nr:pyruvate oxidoreductase subunit gamma [Ectothiorhodospiraceae bacterium BW-2]
MIEVRIHGRGGQGNVVAAYLLATAAIHEGRYGQAFPAFGAERRGAPVVAFVRITAEPLKRRNQVVTPDYLIIQDQALLHVPGVLDGLKPEGAILINSTESSEQLSAQLQRQVIAIAATELAKTHLGRPVPNTALLAAFNALTEILPPDSLLKVLESRFKGPVLEKNQILISEARQLVPAGLWATKQQGEAA